MACAASCTIFLFDFCALALCLCYGAINFSVYDAQFIKFLDVYIYIYILYNFLKFASIFENSQENLLFPE
jgi:hypothetical protein